MYAEVFGGAAWVLFHKPPGKEKEIYNDYNNNLSNLFLCVQNGEEALEKELEYIINSRAIFDYMKNCLKTKVVLPDLRRAAYFYALIRYSYASNTETYACRPHSIKKDFPLMEAANERLQSVCIENMDCVDLINREDSPGAFFYCDPPYLRSEYVYKNIDGFGWADHVRLAERLFRISGKFLVSYNDCPEIRELYTRPGITIETTTRLANMKQRYNPGEMFPELLIANYDTMERAKSMTQLSLFQDFTRDPQELIKERILIA